jgi:hypothetical protein
MKTNIEVHTLPDPCSIQWQDFSGLVRRRSFFQWKSIFLVYYFGPCQQLGLGDCSKIFQTSGRVGSFQVKPLEPIVTS